MTLCVVTGYQCNCQPDEGMTCTGVYQLREENERLRKALSARLQELEQLKQSCEGLALLAFPRMAREAVPGDI